MEFRKLENISHVDSSLPEIDPKSLNYLFHFSNSSQFKIFYSVQKFTMLRFIGNNLDSSDFSRAAQWTGRIKELKEKGLQKFFLFIHEPDDIKAPEMAAHFLKQINEHLNLTIDFNLLEPTMHLQPKLFTLFDAN